MDVFWANFRVIRGRMKPMNAAERRAYCARMKLMASGPIGILLACAPQVFEAAKP
jgi:hypothetical protein